MNVWVVMLRKKQLFNIGYERVRVIVDMMVRHWQHLGYEVYLIKNAPSLLDKIKKRPTGDRFYVYRKGITIVERDYRKPIDVFVYKDGQLLEAWEITNYDEESWMTIEKFRNYLDNLTYFNCSRYLVVSFPEVFRRLDFNKPDRENIEWAENFCKEKGVNIIYWGKQSKYENYVMQLQNYLMKGENESFEIKGWRDKNE